MDELEKLEKQIADLEKAKQDILNKRRAGVLQDVLRQIAQYGFTAKELGLKGGSSGSKKEGQRPNTAAPKREAKYQNPNNAFQTWAGGKGIKPKWVKEHLANGGKLDDFLIKNV